MSRHSDVRPVRSPIPQVLGAHGGMDRSLTPTHAEPPSPWHPSANAPTPAARTPLVATPVGHAPSSHGPGSPSKGFMDYLDALRRGFALVLAVAILIGGAGTIYVLRQPDQYRAMAQIKIKPPQFDSALVQIITGGQAAGLSGDDEYFVANTVERLKGLSLAKRVARQPTIADPDVDPDAVAEEILENLQIVGQPQTTYFNVYLKGTDPQRTAGMLNQLIRDAEIQESHDQSTVFENVLDFAKRRRQEIQKELENIDRRITELLNDKAVSMAPNGNILIGEQYSQILQQIAHRSQMHESMQLDYLFRQIYPDRSIDPIQRDAQKEMDQLREYADRLGDGMQQLERIIRYPSGDLAYQNLKKQLARVEQTMARLRGDVRSPESDSQEMESVLLDKSRESLKSLRAQSQKLLDEYQQAMPMIQEFQNARQERERLLRVLEERDKAIGDYETLKKQVNGDPPITIESPAHIPVEPFAPNRPLMIAFFVALGLAAGGGLVCAREHFDHRVKAPEQLVGPSGLDVPLLGVVARMPHSAQLERGGHLWTHALPQSEAADAYRNLRASLVADRPLSTILITSARAGEGKSTTALNLAATCARAGERTLLLEADLRKPSLAPVFPDLDDQEHPDDAAENHPERPGLTDILLHGTAWQSTLVATEIALLDYMPTGSTRDAPVEILGTLELRQLLLSLAKHYDRVILDGPAVLGLADCRMLGQLVDAAVLVVRSGAGSIKPITRARHMLAQSRVPVVGAVFNGLNQDLNNWSSYGEAAEWDRPLNAPMAGPRPMLATS